MKSRLLLSGLQTRRSAIRRAGLAAGMTALNAVSASPVGAAGAPAPAVTRGRLGQSIVQWCFESFGERWTVERTCRAAKALGCRSVELVAPEHYATLQKHGLSCAIGSLDLSPDPPYARGFNNPAHWPRVIEATRQAIDAAAANGVPNVICFTGFRARRLAEPDGPTIPAEEGAARCVEGLRKTIGYAEEKGITLCLEMLNSRVTSHPMKGHPGYQGDHIDFCADIVRRVASPRMKLLFDIYHVQVMDGDLVRRIRQLHPWIGHVHVAGNPGRGELDEDQEINVRPVMEALVDVGYTGLVGHEFIPTRDPMEGLRQAVSLCDV